MDERQWLQGKVILITGASGFTGGHACEYFAKEMGMSVVAIVRQGNNLSYVDGVRYYSCDLSDSQRLREVVMEVAPDYVLHLGGKNSVSESWENPLLYIEINVLSTLYLLDALRLFPSCKIVIAGSRLSGHLSTSSFQSSHPYGLSKSLQKIVTGSWRELMDQYVIQAEPSNLIGPGPSTGFCSLLGERIVRKEKGQSVATFHVSSRTARRDFLDVRDAIRGYGMLLCHGVNGEIYPICSGVEITLGETTETMMQVAGSDLPVTWGEDTVAVPANVQLDTPIKAQFLENLGWKPQISNKASLRDVINYFRTREGDRI